MKGVAVPERVVDGFEKPRYVLSKSSRVYTMVVLSTLFLRIFMLALSYPHIQKQGSDPAHLLRFPRVRVAQIVMDYLAHGWSVEEICRQHPYLTPAEAHATMGYYFDHKQEIDQEITQEWAQFQEVSAGAARSPFYTRMKAKGLL